MEKTHYETVVYGEFSVLEILEELRKELPSEGVTWNRFSQASLIQSMEASGRGNAALRMTNYQILFHTYCYHYGSGRTYEVRESIAEMLLNTKLDIDSGLVRSPFSEIMILVPPLLKLQNPETGLHDIYCFYVNLEESAGQRALRVMCIGRPNDKSVHELDDAVFYFRINLDYGKVSECLKRSIDEYHAKPEFAQFVTDEEMEILPRLFHFVLNILLYITSADADIRLLKSARSEMESRMEGLKSPVKIRKLQQRIDKESRVHRYIVGDSIHLSPEEADLYKAIRYSGKHRIRYPVGGHWRLQWVGPKETQEQRPTWIRPHFRGPEIAELIRNVGVLK